MDNYNQDDIEKFRLAVEQLEVARELIGSNSHVKARMAMILVDNLGDVLATRLCESIFKEDSFFAIARIPRINPSEIQEARRDFNTKISILERIRIISGADATILRISHQYRNAAFHRDVHNASTIKILARACFKTVCNLFIKKYDIGVSYGGMDPIRWLLPYAKNTTRLNFREDSKIIASKLLKGTQISIPKFRKDLLEDIAQRLRVINKIQDEVGYCSPEFYFNQILRVAEFFDKNPHAIYTQAYNELMRKTFEGKQSPSKKSMEEIHRYEIEMNRRIEKDLSTFKGTISTKILINAERFPKKIEPYKSIDQILRGYQELDLRLSKFEYYLWEIENEWENAVQGEIDRQRGK